MRFFVERPLWTQNVLQMLGIGIFAGCATTASSADGPLATPLAEMSTSSPAAKNVSWVPLAKDVSQRIVDMWSRKSPLLSPDRQQNRDHVRLEIAEKEVEPNWIQRDWWKDGTGELETWFIVGHSPIVAQRSLALDNAEYEAEKRLTRILREQSSSVPLFSKLGHTATAIATQHRVPVDWYLDEVGGHSLVAYSPYWDLILEGPTPVPDWAITTSAPEWTKQGVHVEYDNKGNLLWCCTAPVAT